MSRIGKQPVPIPDKVKVDIKVTPSSSRVPRQSSKTFAPVVKITIADKKVTFARPRTTAVSRKRCTAPFVPIIAGMVKGRHRRLLKDLEIQGVGFKANLKGKQLDLALGYSHPILMDIPDGIKITVTDQTKLKVEGADKQLVGAVTAEIRGYYPPEPYKGKGVRIVGERVRRKEGKTVA